jgi:cytochrome oxidase Cu insertion factor (SCO1/SenC/PrrC family)
VKTPFRLVTGALVVGAVAFALAQKSPEVEQAFSPRGPSVGERLPAFELPDQKGVVRNFDSLRGPRGLVLVFFQSADW